MSGGKELCLNENEVKSIVRKPIHVVGAMNKKSLVDLLENDEPIVRIMLHYQNDNNAYSVSGHWCALYIDKPKKKIYFYDSYGEYPDDQLNHIRPQYRMKTDQVTRDVNILLNAALREGYKIEYNDHKHQERKKGINTCGRWAGTFLKRGGSIEEFNNFVRKYAGAYKIKNLDDAIVKLTDPSINY